MLLADILPTRDGERTLTIADLRPRECRWPISGTGHAMRCCGVGTEPGEPYCYVHMGDAYPAGRRRRG